jgi:hypothetical protein
LILASDLLRIGDLAAASEEALYATAHTARAMLFKSDVFPLSRPEMVDQLVKTGYRTLAELLRRLLLEDEDARFLYRTIRYLKKLLVSLDKATFGTFARGHARDAGKRAESRRAASKPAG